MKKILAYKSISEIISTAIILFLSLLAVISMLVYYDFIFTSIDVEIKVLLFVFVIIAIVSFMQLLMLIGNPKIMVEHDDNSIYFYRRKQNRKSIPFNDIQNIYTKTSIWTKPFVVYTAIVIITKNETYYLRHISKMNEVKDVIQHIAYAEKSN
ncbi:MAG: hypothetical protein KKG64_05390 [Firmicutes bacterium]|nr:hypothetical protein [Bacillota bacterium]